MNEVVVTIGKHEIARSLELLQRATDTECVLLWLGTRTPEEARVTEVYRPEQIASSDYFEIPRASMAELLTHLRVRGLIVLAQIHTHPERAFHSWADDRWAIVRHVGALSLVLPYFAQETTAENFWRDVATFQLDSANRWIAVDAGARTRVLRERP